MATEGNLEAPTRHALDWKNPDLYNEEKCFDELERIFDICHGCRRCVSSISAQKQRHTHASARAGAV